MNEYSDKQKAWQNFSETGLVGAYLVYCAMKEKQNQP